MEISELKVCELNTENLFISMELYEGQDLAQISESEWRGFALSQLRKKQKPISKIWGLSKAILDMDADVLLLTEVGGKDSLENFNLHFLNDSYNCYFIEGNSKRNIDLGFLVKKDLAYRAEAHSNRDTPIEVHTLQGKYLSRFSRDVAELRLYDPIVENSENPKYIILLVHLKSQLSTENDPKGKDVRTAEVMALAQLYEDLRTEFPEVPIILGGDFNSQLSSLEMEFLKRTDLADFHDLLQTPMEDRYSLVHFDFAGNPHPMVLDHLLVSPHLTDRIIPSKSFTYRYKGFYGIPETLPMTLQERYKLPSDHFPLLLTLRV